MVAVPPLHTSCVAGLNVAPENPIAPIDLAGKSKAKNATTLHNKPKPDGNNLLIALFEKYLNCARKKLFILPCLIKLFAF
jgi:hypothetical protein